LHPPIVAGRISIETILRRPNKARKIHAHTKT
jgi:hypothetical protein